MNSLGFSRIEEMRKHSGVDSFQDQIEPLRVEGVKTEVAPREEGVR